MQGLTVSFLLCSRTQKGREMKFKKRNDKANNSIRALLKKLKRHDTMVVAIAVVLALALSGGLIYVSTPVVAGAAKEEFIESERETNELTKEKLQEIHDYLEELDRVVTRNQDSLSAINEKTESTETRDSINNSLSSSTEKLHTQSKEIKSDTQKIIVETEKITNTISEKVTELDGKLDDVHKNINTTITKIEELRSEFEETNRHNAEQIKKSFEEINTELTTIQKDYEDATKKTRELTIKLNAELEKLVKDGNEDLAKALKEDKESHDPLLSRGFLHGLRKAIPWWRT